MLVFKYFSLIFHANFKTGFNLKMKALGFTFLKTFSLSKKAFHPKTERVGNKGCRQGAETQQTPRKLKVTHSKEKIVVSHAKEIFA